MKKRSYPFIRVSEGPYNDLPVDPDSYFWQAQQIENQEYGQDPLDILIDAEENPTEDLLECFNHRK